MVTGAAVTGRALRTEPSLFAPIANGDVGLIEKEVRRRLAILRVIGFAFPTSKVATWMRSGGLRSLFVASDGEASRII